MARLTYEELIKKHLRILRSLRAKSGLFLASKKGVATGYDKSWLRDNFYETLAFEVIGDWKTVEKTYRAILKVFLKHEDKIDWAIKNPVLHDEAVDAMREHAGTFALYSGMEEWEVQADVGMTRAERMPSRTPTNLRLRKGDDNHVLVAWVADEPHEIAVFPRQRSAVARAWQNDVILALCERYEIKELL